MIGRQHVRGIVTVSLFVLLVSCSTQDDSSMQEIQVTSGPYGHMLNSSQVFSPDDRWVAYDTRNDQTHISQTCCIEKVNTETGEIVKLYSAPHQTAYGPGVGAVAFHPKTNKVIFIHGLFNCDASKPYGFTRRFGAILDEATPGAVSHAEARGVDTLVAGALRGGTHAYSWSDDGEWISFTYNDYLMEQLEKRGMHKDLRTIGVMAPALKVDVGREDAENFSGQYFSVVAATVTAHPRPGSNDIEKAFDECWIGLNGYVTKAGTRQQRALAFQGDVRTADNTRLTEVFVSDIPDDITVADEGAPLAGTHSTRPAVPKGLVQRRITFTEQRRYPGVQGPRFWMRSSPDGAFLYFLMKDDSGIVQVYEVPTRGGEPRQVTRLTASVQAQFNVSPDGQSLALIAGNSVWVTDIQSRESVRLTAAVPDENAPVLAVVWNHQGNALVYNRYVGSGSERYLQIFSINL